MRIDHHRLDATTSSFDIDALIEFVRADHSPSRGVVVPPVYARQAVDALRGTGIRVASVVGYPLGFAKPTFKAIEATSLAKDGVDAIEVTPLAANVLAADGEALRDELLEIVRGVRAARPTTSVHVRLMLDDLRDFDCALVADAIVRGACDGVVLKSKSLDCLRTALATFASSNLERKLISPVDLADISPDAIGIGRPESA